MKANMKSFNLFLSKSLSKPFVQMMALVLVTGLLTAHTVFAQSSQTNDSTETTSEAAEETAGETTTDASDSSASSNPLVQPALSSGDLTYYILAAETAARRRQFEQALDHYRIAANASEDPRIAERATNIALFINDEAATLALAHRWHELEPDNPRVDRALAIALLNQQQIEQALPYLEAVRESATSDPHDGFATISNLINQVNDRELAFTVMEKLLERHPQSAYALYYHALAALGVERSELALSSLQEAIKLTPEFRLALLLRAQVKIQNEDAESALAELDEAVKAYPDDRELRLGYARLLVGADKLEESRAQFEILAQQNPDDTESLYALGVLAADAGQLDVAEDYFKRLLELDERVDDAHFELGKIEEERNNYPEAQQWYERIGDGERYLSAQVRAATMLARQGEAEKMNERMAELRSQNPEDEIALYLAESDILREEKLYQQAFDKLSEALENHPNNNDVLYARALAAEKVDRLDVLEADLKEIIASDPDNGHALNALGYTLADRTERYEEALGYLEKAIVLLPEDAAVLDSMGWIKYRLGEYQESLKYLQQAYELNDDPEIVSHLSEVLWNAGQHEEAREIWRKAFDAAPDNEYLLKLKERLNFD